MKYTGLILAIALSIGISSINFGSEPSTVSTASSSLVTWTQSALYNVYQGMINSFTGLINIPHSIMDTVSAWNDQRKMFVATAVIASLLVTYQKKVIKQWLNDMVERLMLTKETQEKLKSINVEEIPWDENYKKRVKAALQ